MSFTTEVSEELLRVAMKKPCCRKALLLGLLCGCRDGEGEERIVYYYDGDVAKTASELLERVFRKKSLPEETVRAGRKTYALRLRASSVSAFLDELDGEEPRSPHLAVGFRCAACGAAFLRGVFLGCGTVTDPHKGYHLELTLPTKGRADFLADFLTHSVGKPGRVRRGERFGVYYKNNGAISGLLYYIGCSGTSFDVTNASIEREIRNQENRATNCVARNISRSVDASRKQRAAIEWLMKTRKLDSLPEELRYTAELRMEYPSASLLELALLHQPPISKSGLNRRLTKLLEAFEDARDA